VMLRVKDIRIAGTLGAPLRGLRRAGLRIGLLSICATAPMWLMGCGVQSNLGPTVVTSPFEDLPESSRPDPSDLVQTIIDDLDDVERQSAEATDAADKEILGFRLDRLTADLTDLLAQGNENYEVYLGLGRSLALSHSFGRQGAGEVAVHMFEQASLVDPLDAEAWYRRGTLLLDLGRPAHAATALEAASERTNADQFADLDFHRAVAHRLSGEDARALAALAPYVDAHPDDESAQRLLSGLLANEPARRESGSISLGFEGNSLVRYEVSGATWLVVHETLGFQLGLPVSWQIVDEQIDEDQGGYVQCAAPPVAGANREWRSDTMTVWAVPMGADGSVDRLVSAYRESIEDLQRVEVVDVKAGAGARLRMTRTPFMGEPLEGAALVVVSANTGYVVEFWGDAISFSFVEPQLDAIIDTFRPLGGADEAVSSL